MSRTAFAVPFVAMALGACASLGAREPLVSDRPDFTDGPLLVVPGIVQAEGGSTVRRDGGTRAIAHGEMMVRTGLSRRVELRVAGNSYVTRRTGPLVETGVEDAGVGVKLRMIDQGHRRSWKPALSVLLGSTVPTGAQPYRSRRAQPEAKAILAWTLGDRLTLASNVNLARPFDGVRSHTSGAASASFGYAATARVTWYAESYAIAQQERAAVTGFANGGVAILLSPDVQVDARAGLGLGAVAHDFFAGVGLAVRR